MIQAWNTAWDGEKVIVKGTCNQCYGELRDLKNKNPMNRIFENYRFVELEKDSIWMIVQR
ncbi:hypothetical protein [Burkholderia cenocepacia]|uniref:hypothetical protein n=1 Tax=Burkholderia cenocepacia TaxID=95486 RepID=UPI001115A5F2|nr:hypothetical protein [Burkholderia cenocepacia]